MEWNKTAGADTSSLVPSMHVDELKEVLRAVIDEQLSLTDIRMAAKWQAGTLVLKPGDPSLKSYEVPIETFFHKIVMVRDRLRVMEQKVNAHKGFSDAEKVEMQQYITKIYGSLTSFNILFRDREDNFTGEGR